MAGHWETTQFVFPYIKRGPWVESEGKRERAIKITFDDFLQPAVKAWWAGLPYKKLIYDISDFGIELISSYVSLPHVHADSVIVISDPSSEDDYEIDRENRNLDMRRADDQILYFFSYPYLSHL